MKKLKTLLVLALMGLATSASAQLVTSSSFSSSSSGSSIWTTVNTDGYNRIYVSYLPSKLDLLGVFDFKMNGSVQAGYLRGISLTRKVPLYLEVGGAVQYRKGKLSQESASVKINVLSVNIPVSLAYRVNVTDEWAISPNFGFDFRVNATGKLKASDGVDESSYDLFDDGGAKRFQAGWHIGVGFDYRALHFGVDYGTDFNDILLASKIKTASITLGWNF